MAALTHHFIRGSAISENLRQTVAAREHLISAWTAMMRLVLNGATAERS
jgi:hypothetical protein